MLTERLPNGTPRVSELDGKAPDSTGEAANVPCVLQAFREDAI